MAGRAARDGDVLERRSALQTRLAPPLAVEIEPPMMVAALATTTEPAAGTEMLPVTFDTVPPVSVSVEPPAARSEPLLTSPPTVGGSINGPGAARLRSASSTMLVSVSWTMTSKVQSPERGR